MVHKIRIPYGWQPREYQRPLIQYLQNDGKRAVCVWHRRAGKDLTVLHWTIQAALRTPGVYWHMLPTLSQARRVIWDGQDNKGRRLLDAFPGWREYDLKTQEQRGIVKHVRNDEMKIELVNGSIWQCVGSDNYDRLIGANPRGVIFSEWSVADPEAWSYIEPILVANKGWCIWIYTPRGHNHGLITYENAKSSKGWFCQLLTIDDTSFTNEVGETEYVVSKEQIEELKQTGTSEQKIAQEFYCSFDAPLEGAIYADEMTKATEEGRIGHVPHDPNLRVETWWDLGYTDATAIWFVQRVGQEIHLIDYYENSDKPLSHFVNILEEKREDLKYKYSHHVFPQDVKAHEFISGKSREEVLKQLGITPKICPSHSLEDGIEAARSMLRRCFFDHLRCKRGVQALREYQRERVRKLEKDQNDPIPFYRNQPVHNWASHAADSFRYGAVYSPPKSITGFSQPKLPIV